MIESVAFETKAALCLKYTPKALFLDSLASILSRSDDYATATPECAVSPDIVKLLRRVDDLLKDIERALEKYNPSSDHILPNPSWVRPRRLCYP